MSEPIIHAAFHAPTNTIGYLVIDSATRDAAIIDPVLDFDAKSGRSATTWADAMLEKLAPERATLRWILETHVHADHLSAAQHLKSRTGAKTAIGRGIAAVQRHFKTVFVAHDVIADGSAFDRLVADGEQLQLGSLAIDVIETPGHTPDSVSYRIGANVFVGDTMFMPDFGTARCDFPGGDARALYRSIHRLYALPPETTLWLCHDYKAPGRDVFVWRTTLAEQRAANVHIKDGVSEDDFVVMRQGRDRKLDMPALIIPALQVNMRAGSFPPPESDGVSYLRIPINKL
jgi:glyoxylase-like metal-dependent hydrolase (beta-lactamase superfamily II)